MPQPANVVVTGFVGYRSILAARRLVAMSPKRGADAAGRIKVTAISPEVV